MLYQPADQQRRMASMSCCAMSPCMACQRSAPRLQTSFTTRQLRVPAGRDALFGLSQSVLSSSAIVETSRGNARRLHRHKQACRLPTRHYNRATLYPGAAGCSRSRVATAAVSAPAGTEEPQPQPPVEAGVPTYETRSWPWRGHRINYAVSREGVRQCCRRRRLQTDSKLLLQ